MVNSILGRVVIILPLAFFILVLNYVKLIIMERDYWIAFSAFGAIGAKRFKLLVSNFKSAKKAWLAERRQLIEAGLTENLVNKFETFRQNFDYKKYAQKLKEYKIETLTSNDQNYPLNLKEIDDCPYVLYVIGNLENEDNLSIGVVGTRKITSYGRQITESLTADLVSQKIIIVSGLAYGVDLVAHETALNFGGRTIGVWAGGLETVFSGFRKSLVERIINSRQGAIVSEFPLGFNPNTTSFPQRNRIISGLSLGVLVTEAASDSGSLITANFARKQGRLIFAVPGQITSQVSRGTIELIKENAILVSSSKDIFDVLKIQEKAKTLEAKKVLQKDEDEARVIEIVKNEPRTLDELVRILGLETGKVISLVTTLEMKGMVNNQEGFIYLK